MSLQNYRALVDTGDPWFGGRPSHWESCRLKHAVNLLNIKMEPNGQRYVGLENVSSWTGRYVESGECQPEGLSNVFCSGSVLFGKLRPYLAKSLLATFDGICSSEFLVLQGKAACPAFLHYLTLADGFVRQVDSSTYGAKMPRASWEDISRFLIHVPSPDEQSAIANFLDRETAKIDTLIENQERLIKLLEEKRQAVISHAVTKGLNPDVRMKDSGVEWLGAVPEHWSILALSRVTKEKCDGPFGSGLKSEHYSDSGVRVIRLQNIKIGEYHGGDGAFVSEEYYKRCLSGHDVAEGDLLIAGLGDPRNPVGRACVAPPAIEPAMVKADCFRFRIDPLRARAQFLAQQLSSGAWADAGRLSSGATRDRIPLSIMATRKVALPSLSEQALIVDRIHEIRRQSDGLHARAVHAIELLRERRTALISAAVTGKIDVRNAV